MEESTFSRGNPAYVMKGIHFFARESKGNPQTSLMCAAPGVYWRKLSTLVPSVFVPLRPAVGSQGSMRSKGRKLPAFAFAFALIVFPSWFKRNLFTVVLPAWCLTKAAIGKYIQLKQGFFQKRQFILQSYSWFNLTKRPRPLKAPWLTLYECSIGCFALKVFDFIFRLPSCDGA